MDILSWIIAGGIVGAIINIVVPEKLSVGFLGAMGAGALGGVVVSFICSVLGLLPELQFSINGVISAVIGSVIAQLVILGYRKTAHV